MSAAISRDLSLLVLPTEGDDDNGTTTDNNKGEPSVSTSRMHCSIPSYSLLSAELWLMVFRNLDRNDLDSCERVCIWWHRIIRYNNKYLSGRVIDYIMFSSKRAFSMILSSGDIVKVYRYAKYFTLRDTLRSIGHPSFMTVKTYRRSPLRPKPRPGSNQLRLFIEELRMLTNEVGADSSNGDQIGKFGSADAIGLHYPHLVKKTPYKIQTPPAAFFIQLSKLLRNLCHVKYMMFQTFSLTNAFIERFIYYVEFKIVTNEVRLIRFKLGKTNSRAVRFFLDTVLGNKHIWSDLPPLQGGTE